ncbi:hypothetical protein [Rothia terrae]|uniref:Uncharacterized protein n=1 Tax=Rothia terrae TaxID=396015 RepID=A0A7S6WW96_9MICC|nr:hypothetical protein [Rothia terrae]QOW64654.1 hypothetical protein IDM49_11570 [Rothia terrae]
MVKCSSSSCQHATGNGCVCACGHGNHGAKARLRWAVALRVPAGQRTSQQENDSTIAAEQRCKARIALTKQSESLRLSRTDPRRHDANAFFEANRSLEIVDWLIEHPTELEQMQWIADQIGDSAETLLTQHKGKHHRVADHLWCDILAALAVILEKALKTKDKIVDLVASEVADGVWRLLKSQRNKELGNAPCQKPQTRNTTSRLSRDISKGLDERILKKTIQVLVEKIIKHFTSDPVMSIENLLLQIRLLALLFCPDPYAHRAVWNHCMIPLLKERIIAESLKELQTLKRLFDQKWTWPL